ELLGCGEALIGQMVAQMLPRSVTIWTGKTTSALLMENRRVAGIKLSDGSVLRARRGVILATGGYEGNERLVKQFEGFPEWMNPFAPTNSGDGLVLGMQIGANVARIAVNNSLFVGAAV